MEGLPPCLLDPWSRRFVEQRKGDEGGLLGSVPMAMLRLLARLAKVDISDVDAMHATIRRRVFSRFQTHSQTLSEVSSEWVCGRHRRTGKPRDLEVSAAGAQATIAVGEGDELTSKRTRCGGAWRAFVRERSLGNHSNDFTQTSSDLPRQYQALTDEELSYFKSIGQAATEAGQQGATGSCFGPISKEVNRAQARRVKEARMAASCTQELALHGATAIATCERVDTAIAKALQE